MNHFDGLEYMESEAGISPGNSDLDFIIRYGYIMNNNTSQAYPSVRRREAQTGRFIFLYTIPAMRLNSRNRIEAHSGGFFVSGDTSQASPPVRQRERFSFLGREDT